MRYEGDINTAQQVELNMPRGAAQWKRAGLGTLSDTDSSPLGSSKFLISTYTSTIAKIVFLTNEIIYKINNTINLQLINSNVINKRLLKNSLKS